MGVKCLTLVLYVIVEMLILRIGSVTSQNETCIAVDYAIRMNFSMPLICTIPSHVTDFKLVVDNVPLFTTFVTFQMHTYNQPLTGSLTEVPTPDTAMTNSSVGLDWIPVVGQYTMNITVLSKLEEDVAAMFVAIPYNMDQGGLYKAPVPGACNQVFMLEDDPTLHISYDPGYQITTIEFAAANIGYPRGEFEPICDTDKSARFRLQYIIYVRFLEYTDLSESDMFQELHKMMTVNGVEKHGKKIKTFEHKDKPLITFMTYEGHGAIYNIIVKDPESQNMKSAYIPLISHACNMTPHHRNSTDRHCQLSIMVDKGTILAYTFTALAGLVLLYFGHRLFFLELFFFGALPLGFGFHLVFAANTSISNIGLAGVTALFGTLGGCSFMALWWRFGKEMPTVLLISLDLGLLFSATLFFTPFGALDVWHTTAAYGLTLTCGILIVPVMLILIPKWLCIFSSAFWGSYMIVAAFSYFLGGILQYIIINIIRRSSVPGYASAVQVTPFRVIDYTLVAMWPLLVVTGVLIQRKLVEGKPPLPPCPYKLRKNMEQNTTEQRSPSPKPTEQTPHRPEPDENSPLLVN